MELVDLIKQIWDEKDINGYVEKIKNDDNCVPLIYVYLITRYKDIENKKEDKEKLDNILKLLPKSACTCISSYVNADDCKFNTYMRSNISRLQNEDLNKLFSTNSLNETYTDKELRELKGKTFNQQKIQSIYRRKKYNGSRLFAKTKCIKCGREKLVYLSNLVNDPDKYGSCICSDVNIDAKIDSATSFYNGTKKLASNTSGYTGVSYVKTYNGKPYDKWRAYIEVDGKRTYLGDFTFKKDAIEARKAAGTKGISWYKTNKAAFKKSLRKKGKGKEKFTDVNI